MLKSDLVQTDKHSKMKNMKKKILLLGILILNNFCFAQITTTKIPLKKDNVSTIKYDSLKNFLGKNINQYLNQELYLIGKDESLRKYGYSGFFNDYKKSTSSFKNTYKPIMPFNKKDIEQDYGGGRSEYDSIAEKYFKVIGIHEYSELIVDNLYMPVKYFLELEEKESKEIIYYEYNSEFESGFPFIMVGFFTKLEEAQINKSFVLGRTEFRYGQPLDIETGLPIKFNLGDIWKCVGLTFYGSNYFLEYILKDENNQKFTIYYKNFNKNFNIYSVKDAENYKKKFGVTNWNKLLLGKVTIGMSKEMCELSWGKPDNINSTISSGKKSEQWVYDNNYLYFDNGVLTTIQK